MAKKADIKQIDQVAAAHGPTGPLRGEFGNAVEDAKAAGHYPVAGGKLTWQQLHNIAVQFKSDQGIK